MVQQVEEITNSEVKAEAPLHKRRRSILEGRTIDHSLCKNKQKKER